MAVFKLDTVCLSYLGSFLDRKGSKATRENKRRPSLYNNSRKEGWNKKKMAETYSSKESSLRYDGRFIAFDADIFQLNLWQ
ncbi:hypothetical protein CEXT_537831 [Caerostris extrusa]|uniref:Uncharacterized protein n=1 Tax=Caerostris extrusa TaxID=172846 RepID=A0AAV4NC09_CAEEX|nr:hypothetical protein CEXT_537831 [Caerostris extrusa]